jgi:ribokinase
MKYDFVAIGDIVTDAFIELSDKDAKVICSEDGRACQLSMNFGAKLPYKEVTVIPAVGNSPNAAVSANRLGLKAALYANIGNDRNGKDCLDALRQEGISTEYVVQNEGMNSNYHYVLRYGAERTILIKHEEYPYKLPVFLEPPRWLYFSSVGDNSLPFHHEIAAYVRDNPETKLVLQPGTFQIRLGYEALKDLYKVTEIFFCNKEEAQEILSTSDNNVGNLLKGLRVLGPKIPVITDGPKGAYALDGDDVWFMPIYPDPAPPVDRTGAGDSFASTFTAAIALGLDVKTALSWGPINSMSVVQYIGAQKGLLSRQFLEEYLSHAPAEYIAKKI